MKNLGLLGEDQFGGTLGKLTKGAAGELGLGGPARLAGAAEAGSTGAQSLINRAMAGGTGKDPADLLTQILRVLQQSQEYDRREAADLARAVRDGKVNLNPAGGF